MPLPDGLSEENMLTQPLLTEEGFINPACRDELEAAIRNRSRIYDRFIDDPEWSKKYWTSITDITGGLAKYAIRQSPYGYPEGLDSVVKYLMACLKSQFPNGLVDLIELSLNDVARLLYQILYDDNYGPFLAWNQAKRQPTDTERETGFRSPDADFIGLDALITNVCIDLRFEHRDRDRFDAEFERKHGKVD